MMKKKMMVFSLLFSLLAILFLTASGAAEDKQLLVTVDGVNVTLDWSVMPEASSYTLYYALADYKGDIDVDTIGSIEMGGKKSLYVPGCPVD